MLLSFSFGNYVPATSKRNIVDLPTVAAPMLSASQELSGFSCLRDRHNHACYSICRCRIMTADHEREDQSSRRLDFDRRLLSNRLGLVRHLRRSLVESARQNHD